MKISTAANLVAFSCYVSSISVAADDQQQRQACTSDADCTGGATVEDGPGAYCSMVDNTCLAAGDCTALEDCTENLSNIFAVPMCLGTMYCMEDADASSPGRCVNICLGTPSTCDALDACVEAGLLEGECCPTTDGTFLACCFADPDNNGTEEEDTVATDPEDSPAEDDSLMNEMMMGDADAVVPGTLPEADPTEGGDNPGSPVADDSPADADDSIPGTMPADPDESGENPDSPVVEDDFPADVDLLVPPGTIIESGSITMIAIRCLADSDCNTSQDNSDYYCAAGTCLPQGGCLLDTDCMNPSNYGIKDTKCVGYLFCDTSVNLCARECTGFDCPGEVPATECSVTGCDTRIACQGSVNCIVDNCDANCKGIFFDSSGTVLEECTGGKGGNVNVDAASTASGSSTADSTSPATDVTTTADDATTGTVNDVSTPASAASVAASDTPEAAAAASSATVSIFNRVNFLSASLICTMVVVAMTGLVVGII